MNMKRLIHKIKSIVQEPKVFALVVQLINGQSQVFMCVAYSLEEAMIAAKNQMKLTDLNVKLFHSALVSEIVSKAYDFEPEPSPEELKKIDKNALLKEIIDKRDLTKFKKYYKLLTKAEIAMVEDKLLL